MILKDKKSCDYHLNVKGAKGCQADLAAFYGSMSELIACAGKLSALTEVEGFDVD